MPEDPKKGHIRLRQPVGCRGPHFACRAKRRRIHDEVQVDGAQPIVGSYGLAPQLSAQRGISTACSERSCSSRFASDRAHADGRRSQAAGPQQSEDHQQ
jgi:hypothetical protein